ncbi:hypothetical protein CEXT_436131 [Caerostris extrusa]|uniref:Uncharacterized protein n=1 Tax=Caerostris extrusa TaxID=172846 RepID=A0AAV4MT72_CAEEX|nr:hypothetical protein CEXT_436131 [Caerostris extrusa]
MKLEVYPKHEFLMHLSPVNREEPHSPSIYILTTRLRHHTSKEASPNEPGIKSVAALQRVVAINFPTCKQASPGASQLQARPPFATRERERER